MTSSAARLLRLVGLLVLCLTASGSLSAGPGGGGGPQTDCSGTVVVCSPGEAGGCVANCSCDGILSCCIEKCTQCCG